MRKIILALAMMVATSAQAGVTYQFWMESWAIGEQQGGGGDFHASQERLSKISVFLESPGAGGSLDYYSGYEWEDPRWTLTQNGIEVDVAVLGVNTSSLCGWAYCDLTVTLAQGGGGLNGSFALYTSNDWLVFSGTGTSWFGYFASDGPTLNGQRDITGYWRRVPLPGTLALMGLGLAGFATVRRRKQ